MIQSHLQKPSRLPTITPVTIQDLVDVLKKPLTVSFQKEINSSLQQQDFAYITMLSDVFTKLEKLYEDQISSCVVPENGPNLQESLKNLAQCYKCIILVADLNTLDCLMNEANYKATFGALEYLPGLN